LSGVSKLLLALRGTRMCVRAELGWRGEECTHAVLEEG